MEEKKNVTVETTADEYSKTAVPSTARKSFLSVLIISLGYVFVVTSMQAGSVIGVSLSFNSMVWAVLVSSAILTVLSCIMGVIAAKSGLSFGLMARYSFGQVGTWVPVLIVAITTIGWFSIDAYLIGDSAHRLFSWMPTILICILAGIGMTITASKGVDKEEEDKKTRRVIRQERFAGTSQRTFYVGDVRPEEVRCKYESGVLTVLIPKEEPKKLTSSSKIAIE